jgi:hypothetical protein
MRARCIFLRLPAAVLFLLGASPAPAAEVAPVLSPQQLEADWLRQEEVRGQPGVPGHPATNVKPEEDAAGGVDGVKNGQWGFHTENQANPWWQVDLGQATPIDRVLLYNRCDIADRAARIKVLVSDDGKHFQQVYQHNGQVFFGHSDKKPLMVKLDGRTARYVRLQLPGTSYFHLDEVEIYRPGEPGNVALHKPATQSSVSQWSVKHPSPPTLLPQGERGAIAANLPVVKRYRTELAIERGLKLAEDLRRLGIQVDAEEGALRQAEEKLKTLPAGASNETRQRLYFDVCRAVRGMALRNPLVDFDRILFVKRAPTAFPHVSDQHYGWFSRPGGGIYILEGFKTGNPRLRCLTADFAEGSFEGPELSYDGKRVLFAYCRYYPQVAGMAKVDKDKLPADAFYNIYEMNIDGSGVAQASSLSPASTGKMPVPPRARWRRLTHGRYDDFDPRYLPGGEIVFLSTRKGQFLQTSTAGSASTLEATMPDSYVRCGGGAGRPVSVFTLHTMDAGGGNLRPISAFENFEWTPSLAADGRILYARWDYIDRFNGNFMSLWSTNPDGTNSQLLFKNYTSRPQCVFEARTVPGSQKLVFTASAHHSTTGGSLVLLDRTRGTEGEEPMTRLTPEVRFPEVEGWDACYYASPWPLSETYFLVSFGDRPLPPHSFLMTDQRNPVNAQGVYLYDAFGNLTLLYRDPAISSVCPIPLRPRPCPPALPCGVAWDGPQEGRFLVQDVYEGLAGVPRGTIKRLRVVAVPPKVQPEMNAPNLGLSSEDPGKFVLGTVPVEADGSACFRVPSGVPVFFQALDGDGLAVQTMRSLSYVQPNETLSCIGCHESRDAAPRVRPAPAAALRAPSKLAAGPEGSWPFRFDTLVQPVLDRHCLGCHSPGGSDAQAARFDLRPAKAYANLLAYANNDLRNLVSERDRSIAGDCPARKSKLLAMLRAPAGHAGVHLDADALARLATWMDTYAQRLGSFSEQQEAQLREFRRRLAGLLQE